MSFEAATTTAKAKSKAALPPPTFDGEVLEESPTSFVEACGKESPSEVQQRLLWGANVNGRGRFGWTGLMAATVWRNKAIVSLLLKQDDIDINMTDSGGRSTLHHAAWYRNVDTLVMLLADPRLNTINLMDTGGETPLLAAVDNNSVECVQLLLMDPRTDPNIKFEFERCKCDRCSSFFDCSSNSNSPGISLMHGGSPLMWAVKKGLKDCVKLLLPDPRVDLMTTDSYKRSKGEVIR